MKLCTFEIHTKLGRYQRIGVLFRDGILDLNFAAAAYLFHLGEAQPYKIANSLLPSDMLSFLQNETTGFTFAKDSINFFNENFQNKKIPFGLNDETIFYSFDEINLKSPLPTPNSFKDFYAFEQHVKKGFEKRNEEMPNEWYEIPVYYKGNHNNFFGPNDEIFWPSFTEMLDYELEIALIIGKTGKNISEKDALNYVAGFTILNDFSARDIQKKEMKVRLGPAKGKDFATSIGPYIATIDEFENIYNLKMTAKVNGETWSEGNSSSMYHKFEKIIAFASMDEMLFPGDVIASGTVGNGCGLELNKWIQPNDVIELEIEKIGILKNKIVKKYVST